MSAGEKLLLARQLEKLGVDTIEAGFAASSPGDFESVRALVRKSVNQWWSPLPNGRKRCGPWSRGIERRS